MVGKPAKYYEQGKLGKGNILIVIVAVAVIVVIVFAAILNYYPTTFTSVNETRTPMLNEVFHIEFKNNTVANSFRLSDNYDHNKVELLNWTWGRIDPTGHVGVDRVYNIYTFRAIGLGETIISFRMTSDMPTENPNNYRVDVKVR